MGSADAIRCRDRWPRGNWRVMERNKDCKGQVDRCWETMRIGRKVRKTQGKLFFYCQYLSTLGNRHCLSKSSSGRFRVSEQDILAGSFLFGSVPSLQDIRSAITLDVDPGEQPWVRKGCLSCDPNGLLEFIDTATSFSSRLDTRDLQYWMSGQASQSYTLSRDYRLHLTLRRL